MASLIIQLTISFFCVGVSLAIVHEAGVSLEDKSIVGMVIIRHGTRNTQNESYPESLKEGSCLKIALKEIGSPHKGEKTIYRTTARNVEKIYEKGVPFIYKVPLKEAKRKYFSILRATRYEIRSVLYDGWCKGKSAKKSSDERYIMEVGNQFHPKQCSVSTYPECQGPLVTLIQSN